MATLADVQARNRELARQINEEARRDPKSPYAGRFVGIANGQVVVVADDLEEMAQRLEQIEPDPAKCFSVEASRDYDEVVEIWSLPGCPLCGTLSACNSPHLASTAASA